MCTSNEQSIENKHQCSCCKNKSNNTFFIKNNKNPKNKVYYYDSDDSNYFSDSSNSPVKYNIRKKPIPKKIYLPLISQIY